MERYRKLDEQLTIKYRDWLKELSEKCPELLGDKYSNPYYVALPKNWLDSDVRILIVGEEGHGEGGCGKSEGLEASRIDVIKTFNWSYLASNLYNDDVQYELYPDATVYRHNSSAFWRRARALSEYGVCAWSNIDKIHRLGNSNCALTKKERIRLHSIDHRILNDEIELLNPTHIVFFGWYGISLEHELPKLYKELYPNGANDNSVWNQTVVTKKIDGREFICAYHPNWGQRKAGYEENVLSHLKDTL